MKMNKLEKVYKKMQEIGWRIDNVENLSPSPKWDILLNYHNAVLEKAFINYIDNGTEKITEIEFNAIGFISDFINCLKGVEDENRNY